MDIVHEQMRNFERNMATIKSNGSARNKNTIIRDEEFLSAFYEWTLDYVI